MFVTEWGPRPVTSLVTRRSDQACAAPRSRTRRRANNTTQTITEYKIAKNIFVSSVLCFGLNVLIFLLSSAFFHHHHNGRPCPTARYQIIMYLFGYFLVDNRTQVKTLGTYSYWFCNIKNVAIDSNSECCIDKISILYFLYIIIFSCIN